MFFSLVRVSYSDVLNWRAGEDQYILKWIIKTEPDIHMNISRFTCPFSLPITLLYKQIIDLKKTETMWQ